jgi:photosystem II stability/assembly factor-like uncharacterized protein
MLPIFGALALLPALWAAGTRLCSAQPPPAAQPGWVNVTGDVGGNPWGYAGVLLLAAVPDSSQVVAGVSDSGLWETDGGLTWTNIGDRLPDNTNFTSDPIILDSKTFLVNMAGWKQGASWGIYRSEDAGKTWHSEAGKGAER